MARSDDGGYTWSEPYLAMVAGSESSFIELPSGRIVGVVRGSPLCGWPINMTKDDYYDPELAKKQVYRLLHPELPDYYKVTMFICSYDCGYHWSTPRPVVGTEQAREAPADIERLCDGRLVITSGLKHTGKGARATLSYDEGKTWDLEHRYILGGDLPDHQGGHCCSLVLKDDVILSTFTVYPPQSDPKAKLPGSIAAVRWKPTP